MIGQDITVSAPGKIHFLGEHAVVYGKPALIASVGKRCNVRLDPSSDARIEIFSRNLNKAITVSEDEVLERREDAQAKWESFVANNDVSQLTAITKDEIEYPIIAVGEALHFFKKSPPSGFKLSINSDIPIGGGLGSSAAVAVSVVAAMSSFLNGEFDRNVVNDIAFLVEQKKHGMPSGGDNSAVCFGGLLWFRRESPRFKIIQPVTFQVPPIIASNFLIIDSGKPVESTGEMVGYVRGLYQNDPDRVEGFLEAQEKLTRALLSAVEESKVDELIRIIREGEKNLEGIGVVSDSSKSLIKDIEDSGGAAKICGAGGKTKGTGVILAYHKDVEALQRIASSRKFPYYPTELGVEGLRQEN